MTSPSLQTEQARHERQTAPPRAFVSGLLLIAAAAALIAGAVLAANTPRR